MKKSAAIVPAWLERARASWKSKDNPPPDLKWSGHWVKKFLVYMEKRNRGCLPEDVPSMGIVASFVRFLDGKWECKDW